MMFLVRAALWLGIVSVFVPGDFAGEALDMPFDTQTVSFDAGETVETWCEGREAVCEAGEEAARLGGFLSEMAINRLEDVIEARSEESS